MAKTKLDKTESSAEPAEGNTYVHGNPIGKWDPTGNWQAGVSKLEHFAEDGVTQGEIVVGHYNLSYQGALEIGLNANKAKRISEASQDVDRLPAAAKFLGLDKLDPDQKRLTPGPGNMSYLPLIAGGEASRHFNTNSLAKDNSEGDTRKIHAKAHLEKAVKLQIIANTFKNNGQIGLANVYEAAVDYHSGTGLHSIEDIAPHSSEIVNKFANKNILNGLKSILIPEHEHDGSVDNPYKNIKAWIQSENDTFNYLKEFHDKVGMNRIQKQLQKRLREILPKFRHVSKPNK